MKSKEDDLVFYKKCFMILNANCHKYYNDNIYMNFLILIIKKYSMIYLIIALMSLKI